MKKIDLTDTTFCILVRIDSIQRLENIVLITDLLCKYFSTNIVVREADSFNNNILKKLLNKKVKYEFIEDKDPILYRTYHNNQMIKPVNTPYISIWDADIIPYKDAIDECVSRLRNAEADYSYPYNGYCYDVSGAVKSLFMRDRSMKLLLKHQDKLNFLYPQILYGGTIILSKELFDRIGRENEKQYGWSNDDSDRYTRLNSLNLKMFRYNIPLFHLSHPRSKNSRFHSTTFKNISVQELFLLQNSSYEETVDYINQM
jgi:hypothetical protein